MKPLKITMQAFGPFAGCETVDFAQLGTRSFFLIHGPTGAGKTTLLDAICFALYGSTSGGERQPKAMRSDHADASMPTRVELEFALGEQRYRVERSPAQVRARLRGSGTTEVAATAELAVWESGAWSPLAQQASRVTEQIRGLLGFSEEQFRQVIVLPQGRFRDVLTANSSEREEILARLFRTEIYQRIEEALKRASAGLKEAAKRIEQQRAGVLGQVGVTNDTELADQIAAQDSALGAARAHQTSVAVQHNEARNALEAGRQARAALDEAVAAAAHHASVAEGLREHQARQARIEAARRAMAVAPALDRQARAKLGLARADALLGEANDALAAQAEAARKAADELQREQQKEPDRVEARQRVGDLDSIANALEAWQKAERERVSVSKALQAEQVAQDARQDELKKLGVARQSLTEQREVALKKAALKAAADADHERLVGQVAMLRELAAVREELAVCKAGRDQADTALNKAVAARDAALESRSGIERAWVAGQAARLAALLEAGCPCPVCGASEHPAPAHAGSEIVSDESLEVARTACSSAEAALEQARIRRQDADAQLQIVSNRLALLQQSLGELARLSLEEGERRQAAAAAACQAVTVAAQEQVALEQQLAELAERSEKTEQAIAQRQPVLENLKAEHAGAIAASTLHLNAVPEALRAPGALAAAHRTAIGLLEALDAALRKAQDADKRAVEALSAAQSRQRERAAACAQAVEERRDAEEALAVALRDHDFADPEACQAARLAASELAALEVAAREYEHARAQAEQRLTSAQARAKDLAPPDLAALGQRAAEAESALTNAIEAVEKARSRLEELGRAHTRLTQLAEENQDLMARYAVLGRLSEIADGQNPHRMTFQRYVLATLLDEVLEAASIRLLRMSRSRYELQRVQTQTDMRSAGGLDLQVFDHQTGTARPANTLSGGEGFLAALSLALGLADVVQSRTGGIQLETLFVDEGFGTLDPESLDFAINTLIDLQQGGRLVGIISHVTELRERIDVRLEVRPSTKGSRIAFAL